MKHLVLTFILTIASLAGFAQAKKPTLMVVPADNWCVQNNFMDKFDDQGTEVLVPNYKRVLQNSSDCYNVITKINTLMSDDAESPTSLQKDEKSRLTVSSTEIVILAMVNIPHFACEQCVVYNKYADIAMPCLTKEAA